MNLSAPKIKSLRQKLLTWFLKQQRDLPWRRTQDPYAIWVSEIMLQQTQVITVIPYYLKFLQRFPNLKSLAQAQESEVLALWSGLGYYRRAKLLHRGAQKVWEDFDGKLPSDVEALRQIPSIGAYTAGAIASIAFKQPVPLVDGNVVRVLARVFQLPGHAKELSLHKKIWEIAAPLVDPQDPGNFNQALMELGATLCRVTKPFCAACPLRSFCEAFKNDVAENYPATAPQPLTQILHRVVAICEKDERILLIRNPNSRWFQGLWQLPHVYLDEDSAPSKKSPEEFLKEFLFHELGLQLSPLQATPVTRHSITKHKIFSKSFWGRIIGKTKNLKASNDAQLFTWEEIGDLPFSNFDRKVVQAALNFKNEKQGSLF